MIGFEPMKIRFQIWRFWPLSHISLFIFMPFFFFIKEFYYKLIYIINLFIFFLFYTYYFFKIILLFLLNPIQTIKLNTWNHWFSNAHQIQWLNSLNYNDQYYFLPVIEINLPFLTTSFWYIKFFFLFSFYMFLPILLYYVWLNIKPLLKKNENFFFHFHLILLNYFWLFNLLIHHFLIMPYFIQFTFSHYHEFLYYEFDIEFQILFYLNLYFKLLFNNLLIYFIWWIKHQWFWKSPSWWIYIIIFFFLPPDFYIQIIYIFFSYILDKKIQIFWNWAKYIKIYKHKEHEVKH